MAEASDVVRTRRIEVVDDEGQVRVVLGYLGEGDGPVYGMSLRDEHGHERLWVLHDRADAEVGLCHRGNIAAALTVSEWGQPFLYMGDDAESGG